MYRLIMLVLPFLYACQDQAQNPEMWTVQEVHMDVGLVGGHELACADCHVEASFKSIAANCESCHRALFDETTNPDHSAAGYPMVCKECHESIAWKPAAVAHDTLGFALEGAHGRILCVDCHIDNDFSSLPTNCIDCHEDDFNATEDPDHVADQFSQDCNECHSSEVWQPATFDHNLTDFPLTGAHIETDCAGCHIAGVFADLPGTCIDCHQQDFDEVEDPSHIEQEFSLDCTECHSTDAWEPATFDHELTDFPLTGAHIETDCISCHIDEVFTNLPGTCIDCHQQDFDEVEDPSHIEQEFSLDCTECHSTDVWEPATFDHNLTDFPLTGAHSQLGTDCASCHIGGVFADLPGTCIDCHQQDFDEVEDPSHIEQEFSLDCTECHSTDAWEPATFDHELTDFPLTGAHIETDCISCHIDEVFTNLPGTCIDCHQQDFDEVEDPSHIEQEFSLDCTECHSTDVWEPATFDHNLTDFPLIGAHNQLGTDCVSCHIGGVFAGLPAECIDCHQQDFDRVEDPNHVDGQFSSDCTECHSNDAWEPATFDHNLTDFPLTGAHSRTDCASCHIAEVFANLPSTCIDCHQKDEPTNHFGPACVECHTTSAWEPSTFDHEPLFPLTRGNHQRYRTSCTSCHLDPATYEVFTCTDCHDGEHEKRDMDDEHDDVRNYVYESTACFDCHPRGSE